MANTTIQIKKSATTSNVPSSLANGELAINYADGILYYKNTSGQIAPFYSAVNSFGTVNANGTFVVSSTRGDILSIVPGSGISIVGDSINEKITISAVTDYSYANSVGAASNGWANTVAAGANAWSNTKVSSVTGTAGQIYSSGGTTPTLNLITTAVTAATYGNSSIIPVITVDAYGRLTSVSNVVASGGGPPNLMDYAYVNTATQAANTWANTVVAGANAWVNTSVAGANAWSNTKLSNTSGTTFAGSFYIPSGSNLGVGTASPAANLDVVGSASLAKANILSQTLTDGTYIDWNTASGQVATITLAGNRTMNAATNLRVGTYILNVLQDGVGSRTITWNAIYKWPSGVAPTLTTTASARDVISFFSDGTNLYGTYINDVK